MNNKLLNIIVAASLIKLLGVIGAYLLITPPALAVPGSDFSFYRADDKPDNFHTKTYTNGLNGNNANAFQQFANTEYNALDLASINARKLDTTKLEIKHDYDVKVYFINEGGLFRNKIKLISTGSTNLNGFVFKDVSCLEAGCIYPDTFGYYSLNADDTLDLGDYVSVGNIQSGSNLDFQLVSPALTDYYTSDQTFYSDNSLNSDNRGLIAYEYEGYLILAWEDYYDADYNDAIFAVDIGQDNLDCIPSDGEISNPGCNTSLPNLAPTANDDYATTTILNSVTIDVLANDTDPEGDEKTISQINNVLGGSAVIEDNKIVYTAASIPGEYSLTYTVEDENGNTDTGVVLITVTAFPD